MTERLNEIRLLEGPLPEDAFIQAAEEAGIPVNSPAAEKIARQFFTLENYQFDRMTGFLRRDVFLPQVTEASYRKGKTHLLMLMDLIGLGVINDSGGLLAGDKAIIDFTELIKSSFLTSEDVNFARLGGDEFALLYESDTQYEYDKILQSILSRMESVHLQRPDIAPFRLWHTGLKPGSRPEEFLRDADPKQPGLMPYVSFPSGMRQERIESKKHLRIVPDSEPPLLK